MALDITMHSDNELSDIFLNDEYLYGQAVAAGTINELQEIAGELFTFTDDQMSTFEQDFFDGVFE